MMLKRGVPIILVVLSVLIACGFYFSLLEKQKVGEVPKIEINVSKSLTSGALKILEFIVPAQELDWIQQGMTVDEYIKRSNRNIAIKALSQEDVAMLDLQVGDNQAEDALIESGRKTLSSELGRELKGDEHMDLVANELVQKKLNEFLNGESSSTELLPVGAALALYVLLQSISWLLGFFIFWTSAGIFTILVRLGLISISKTTREIEQIM